MQQRQPPEVLPESRLVLQLLHHTAEATVRPAELLQAPVVKGLFHLVSDLLHLDLQHLQLALHYLQHRDQDTGSSQALLHFDRSDVRLGPVGASDLVFAEETIGGRLVFAVVVCVDQTERVAQPGLQLGAVQQQLQTQHQHSFSTNVLHNNPALRLRTSAPSPALW